VPPTQANDDLLAQIFGSDPTPAPAAPTAPAPAQPRSNIDDILGLFGSGPGAASTAAPVSAASPPPAVATPPVSLFGSATPAEPAAPKLTAYPAYEKNGLKITLTPQTNAARPGVVNILARFTAESGSIAGVNFLAAVPKTQQVTLLPMSATDIAPGATETQQMRVVAPPGVSLHTERTFELMTEFFSEQCPFEVEDNIHRWCPADHRSGRLLWFPSWVDG
jgi:AP-1 complex subunit gamma-1